MPVLQTDEWHLLVLAIDGLDARAQGFTLERRCDVAPLVRLAWDLREALGTVERSVLVRATFPVPTRPAELLDPNRSRADA
jgi:hypothetical protein